jgi:hypothetical protein
MAPPRINLDLNQLVKTVNRGGAMGGPARPATNIGAGANMRPARPASGGATAGTFANPSRIGNPAPRGVSRSLVRNATPTAESARSHALAMGGIQHLVNVGHLHPNHGRQLMAKSQAHLDSYAKSKRAAAKKASVPKPMKSFGSLSDDADGGPVQIGLLSFGGPSDVPSCRAMDTNTSPLQTRTSAGLSAVPNRSFNRRRGPMDL